MPAVVAELGFEPVVQGVDPCGILRGVGQGGPVRPVRAANFDAVETVPQFVRGRRASLFCPARPLTPDVSSDPRPGPAVSRRPAGRPPSPCRRPSRPRPPSGRGACCCSSNASTITLRTWSTPALSWSGIEPSSRENRSRRASARFCAARRPEGQPVWAASSAVLGSVHETAAARGCSRLSSPPTRGRRICPTAHSGKAANPSKCTTTLPVLPIAAQGDVTALWKQVGQPPPFDGLRVTVFCIRDT